MDKRRIALLKILTVVLAVYHLLNLVTCEGECEREKRIEPIGEITSTNYPFNYPNNYCKYWYIQGVKGYTITISFVHLEFPSSNGRCNDLLEIGPIPDRVYCSSDSYHQPYITIHDHVWLKLKTDHSITASGFKLEYVVGKVPSIINCGINQYKCDNGKCINDNWRCNDADECGDNSDEVGCDFRASTRPITTLPVVKCNNRELSCRYKSTGRFGCLMQHYICNGVKDCLNGEDEDKKLCKAPGCNEYIHQANGYITSPGYPYNYPNSISCMWRIHSTVKNKPIQLRFVSFQLQSTKNSDYLAVYDGKDDQSPLLGVYNGVKHPPPMIESNTEWLFIKFHTDSYVNRQGFNVTYQTKGMCMHHQRPCGGNDENCYDPIQHCDKVWDCKEHGTDEKGCDHCSLTEFSCGSLSGKCYHEDVRCDGKTFCYDYSDEKNCTADQCGAHRGLYLCDNGRCIYETWKCDNSDDCHDGSDEMDCSRSTTRVVIAAVVGSLTCSLLLVVALGCTCRLYLLRTRDNCRQRQSTPLSRLQIEIMGRRAPPPSYNEAMLTSRPYEEVRQEILSRQSTTVAGEINMTNRPLPVPPYQASAQETGTNSDVPEHLERGESDTVQLIPESNSDSDTSGCDNPNFESDDELLDLADDSNVHIQMTQDVGLLATWRSNTSLPTSDDTSSDTQLLDLSEKYDCDTKPATDSPSDSVTHIPNQSTSIVNNSDSTSNSDCCVPYLVTQLEVSPEENCGISVANSSDTVPLLN